MENLKPQVELLNEVDDADVNMFIDKLAAEVHNAPNMDDFVAKIVLEF